MLKTKITFLLLVVLSIAAIYVYYSLDRSFLLSSEAKKHYAQGDYKTATELAQQAYDLNNYNRMAFTVLVQSEESLKWKKYIEETRKYLGFIDKISYQDEVTKADMLRIKMIVEVSTASYAKLDQNNRLINTDLKDEARGLHRQITVIRDKLFK